MKQIVICFLVMFHSISFADTSYYQKENEFLDSESNGFEKQSQDVDITDVDVSNARQNVFPFITPMQCIRMSIVILFVGTVFYLAYDDCIKGRCYIRRDLLSE